MKLIVGLLFLGLASANATNFTCRSDDYFFPGTINYYPKLELAKIHLRHSNTGAVTDALLHCYKASSLYWYGYSDLEVICYDWDKTTFWVGFEKDAKNMQLFQSAYASSRPFKGRSKCYPK